MPPFISVLTPVYNRADFIRQAVESVLAQNYPAFEHIVVDGGSTDGTLDILAEYPHLRVISEPDRGLYDALNKGLALAGGEWIAWLNSDDIFTPLAFQRVAQALAEQREAAAVSGAVGYFSEDTANPDFRTVPPVCVGDYWERMAENPATNGWFFRAELLRELGGFDASYRFVADRHLFIRLAARRVQPLCVPEVLYRYRQHSGSFTISAQDSRDVTRGLQRIRVLQEDRRMLLGFLSRKDFPRELHRTLRRANDVRAYRLTATALYHRRWRDAWDGVRQGWGRNPLWPLAFLRGLWTRLRRPSAPRRGDDADPRHLALFLPSLKAAGVQRMMVNLANYWAENGLRVDMVLTRAEGAFLKQLHSHVRVVNLDASRALAALRPLMRYLRRERPEALLSAQPHNNLVAIWARALTHVPTRIVVSEHGYLSRSVKDSPNSRERLFPLLLRMFYPCAECVVTVSQAAAEDLIKTVGLSRTLLKVIPNPIVTPQLLAQADMPAPHSWLEDDTVPVMLAVGRLEAVKDYPTLLKAFAILRGERPLRLIVLGEGRLRADLQHLAQELGIADDVDFFGVTENPYTFMRRSAVFALTSRWEGFGIVLVEALACGTQVVATNCPGGPAEILMEGEYGWLPPVGDPQAVAAALREALDHPKPEDALRQRAQDFRVETIADRYLNVLAGRDA